MIKYRVIKYVISRSLPARQWAHGAAARASPSCQNNIAASLINTFNNNYCRYCLMNYI